MFFTAGNHDYYLVSRQQVNKYNRSSLSKVEELSIMIEHLDNVVLFHSKCGVISDKYKDLVFSGLTMTSKPETEEEISFYKDFMNDSKYIYSDVNYLNKMDISSYDLLKVLSQMFLYPIIL